MYWGVSESVSEDGLRLLEVIQTTTLTSVDVKNIIEVLTVHAGTTATDWTKVCEADKSFFLIC